MAARCTMQGLPLLMSLLIAAFAARSAGAASPCIAAYSGSGIVTSPGYPKNYANNTDCTYVLTAGAGSKVVLKFNDFALENSYDFLTITSDGVTVGRYTGSTKPPVLTLGQSVTLHFTSDQIIVDKGFSAAFSTLAANCGGLIAGSGFVRSPGYPSSYGPNLVCIWGVVATQGKTLTLDFQSFQLENNYDFLSLYDGDTLVARFTGSTLPQRVNLGRAARIVFMSDFTVGDLGFSIVTASAALPCGGLLGGGSVAITSPNYPNNYPANASCTWTYPLVSQSVALRFYTFNLEGYNYDTVKIYNGQTLVNTYTGNERPRYSTLYPGPITVVFTSDGTIQNSGFILGILVRISDK